MVKVSYAFTFSVHCCQLRRIGLIKGSLNGVMGLLNCCFPTRFYLFEFKFYGVLGCICVYSGVLKARRKEYVSVQSHF